MRYILVVFLIAIIPKLLFSQRIVVPENLAVYQRTNNNLGLIPIQLGGLLDVKTLKISLSQVSNSNIVVNEFVKNFNIVKSSFDTTLALEGGWYLLRSEITKADGSVLFEEIKTGIGEIFLVAGQSNAEFEGPVAKDERVVGAYYSQDPTFFSILESDDPRWLYPSAPGTSFLGVLGDSLVKKLGVPVLFFNAASGGSSSHDWWRSSIQGGLPFAKINQVISEFLRFHGARGVLWHQGEANSVASSFPFSANDYTTHISQVIKTSRENLGFDRLSWMVAQVSWAKYGITGPDDPSDPNRMDLRNETRSGQLKLTETDEDTFLGPDSDLIEGYNGSDLRDDGVHFSFLGQTQLAALWNEKMDQRYFNQSVPFIAGKSQQSIQGLGIIRQNCLWQKANVILNSGLKPRFKLVSGPAEVFGDSIRFKRDGIVRIKVLATGDEFYADFESEEIVLNANVGFTKPILSDSCQFFRANESVILRASCVSGLPYWYGDSRLNEFLGSKSELSISPKKDKIFYLSCSAGCDDGLSSKYELIKINDLSTPRAFNFKGRQKLRLASREALEYNRTVSDKSVRLTSNKSILLNPGTQIKVGAVFEAQIKGCKNP
ncbi:MAG: hypothetical protein ACI9QN_001631 [Arcticibacterium sp.]|jgi:hypothetical protein